MNFVLVCLIQPNETFLSKILCCCRESAMHLRRNLGPDLRPVLVRVWIRPGLTFGPGLRPRIGYEFGSELGSGSDL